MKRDYRGSSWGKGWSVTVVGESFQLFTSLAHNTSSVRNVAFLMRILPASGSTYGLTACVNVCSVIRISWAKLFQPECPISTLTCAGSYASRLQLARLWPGANRKTFVQKGQFEGAGRSGTAIVPGPKLAFRPAVFRPLRLYPETQRSERLAFFLVPGRMSLLE